MNDWNILLQIIVNYLYFNITNKTKLMNLNPLDILIVVFVLSIAAIGYNNGFMKNIGKLINIIFSSVLANLLIANLALQFNFLRQSSSVVYLSNYILVFLTLLFLIGFITEFILQQIDEIDIDKYVDIGISIIIGIMKGFVYIALILFIFDSTPIQKQSKDLIYNKIEKESFLSKPCNNLKEILFKK